jgi:NADH-quinone oxidoreductase subunit L
MSGEQDIRQMGGLLKKQPITAWTFIIATLAITGVPIPWLAGFISKDAILWSAWSSNMEGSAYAGVFATTAWLIWGLAAVAAVFTAFYMWRLVFLTFWSGETRASEEVKSHIHESPFSMWMPLVVLAGLSIFGGLLNWPHLFDPFHFMPLEWLSGWLAPVVGAVPVADGAHLSLEIILVLIVTGAGFGSFFVAWRLYKNAVHPVTHKIVTENPFRWVYLRLVNKWHVDELYEATTIQPIWFGSKVGLYQFIDKRIIDGTVNLVGWTGRSVGFLGQLFHSGNIQRYLAIFVIGLWVLMMAYFLPMGRVDPNPPEPSPPTAQAEQAGGGQ